MYVNDKRVKLDFKKFMWIFLPSSKLEMEIGWHN